jgi:hypothetical protein
LYPIRCPECGLVNHQDDLAYPHCGQCHEDLVRCSACQHHEANGCRHSRAYTRYTPDLEAAKDCPDYRPRTEIRGSRLLANWPSPLWVSTLLCLILLSLGLATWLIDPAGQYFHGSQLQIITNVPQQVVVDKPFAVTMDMANLLAQPSARIYVQIDANFLAMVDWRMPTPTPLRYGFDRHHALVLEFDPLPSYARRTITLPFVARHSGVTAPARPGAVTLPFIVTVYSPLNQPCGDPKLMPISVVQRSIPGS